MEIQLADGINIAATIGVVVGMFVLFLRISTKVDDWYRHFDGKFDALRDALRKDQDALRNDFAGKFDALREDHNALSKQIAKLEGLFERSTSREQLDG